MKITTTSNEVILLVIKKLGDGHICPNFIEVIRELIQNTGVKDKYLFELERNLELQAAGFLMQKENILLQSQIRTEQFQINLFDRPFLKILLLLFIPCLSNFCSSSLK